MLGIPWIVETRLKRDDIKKNFRARFPNGELPDITNENVVWESVVFSESLCSQDSFRFGLAESSRIEFETVGISNILGMTIECFCEVDLTGADISGIINWGTSSLQDGETVTLENSDLGYPFFRIPYGVFTVQSCPRNHEAMTHRKVTAISTMFHNNKSMCPFEQKKTSAYWLGDVKAYKMKVKEFIAENLAYYGGNALRYLGFTSTTDLFSFGDISETSFTSNTFEFYDSNNQLKQTVVITGHRRSRELTENGTIGFYDGLMGIDLDGYDTETAYRLLKEDLDQYGTNDYSKTIIRGATEMATYGIELADSSEAMDILMRRYLIPHISFSTATGSAAETWFNVDRNSFYLHADDRSAKCFYPNLTGDSGYNRMQVFFPYDVTYTVTDYNVGGTISYSCNPASNLTGVKGYKYNDSNPNGFLGRVQLSFKPTLGAALDAPGMVTRSFANAFSFSKICQGFCELNGLFLKKDRYGEAKLISLKSFYQPGYDSLFYDLPIMRDAYSECWWDEYDIEPIGQIIYSYPKKGEYGEETQTDSMFIGTGGSVYDLSDNYVIENLDDASKSFIETLVKNVFIPAVGNVYFTPVEINSRGFPQLESGDRVRAQVNSGSNPYYIQDVFNIQTVDGNDYLVPANENVQLQGDYIEIQDTTPSGQYVYSFALQCELSGIQNLQEFIKSSQGEIISEGGEEDE